MAVKTKNKSGWWSGLARGVMHHIFSVRFWLVYVSALALCAYLLLETKSMTATQRGAYGRVTTQTIVVRTFPRDKAIVSALAIPVIDYWVMGRHVVRVAALSGEAVLPRKATVGSAGLDLHSVTAVRIMPGETVKVHTGLCMEMPRGVLALVVPRSGLSLAGLSVANSPGVIDSDFRGEVCVLLRNVGSRPYEVHKSDRIAQLVVISEASSVIVASSALSGTERGSDGFGSTGK